jgi:hypothetical protein
VSTEPDELLYAADHDNTFRLSKEIIRQMKEETKVSDRKKIKIESGIPIPGSMSGTSFIKDAVRACKHGDSFLLNKTSTSGAYLAGKQLNRKVVIRTVDKENVRVWVLDKEPE